MTIKKVSRGNGMLCLAKRYLPVETECGKFRLLYGLCLLLCIIIIIIITVVVAVSFIIHVMLFWNSIVVTSHWKLYKCRLIAMGWHGVANATPGQRDSVFLPPLEIFSIFFVALSF